MAMTLAQPEFLAYADSLAVRFTRMYSLWGYKDDLIQEARLACLEAWRNYDQSRDPRMGKNYIEARVWGALVDSMRRERVFSRSACTNYWQHVPIATISLTIESHERACNKRVEAEKLLNTLPEQDRFILLKRYWDDENVASIGRHIHRHPSRVSQLHSVAIAYLQWKLGIKHKTASGPVFIEDLRHIKKRVRKKFLASGA
jgi:RNA polymerase sigma factor (sigma-70 family)